MGSTEAGCAAKKGSQPLVDRNIDDWQGFWIGHDPALRLRVVYGPGAVDPEDLRIIS